jgi:hypothetical protein
VNPGSEKGRNKNIKKINREIREGTVTIQTEAWWYGRTCGELATLFIRCGIYKVAYSAINVSVYIISENMEIPLKPCAFLVNMPLAYCCRCVNLSLASRYVIITISIKCGV